MIAALLLLILMAPDTHALTGMVPGVYEITVGSYAAAATASEAGVLVFSAPAGVVEVRRVDGPQANGCAARERGE